MVRIVRWSVCLSAYVVAACEAPAPAGKPVGDDTLVVVNGVPLGAADLQVLQGATGHGEEAVDRRAALIEGLVQQEVVAQQAVTLGLDRDPQYLEAMKGAQAQLAALRRRELGRAYFRHELEDRARVTDEEVRAYYDANAAQLRATYRVEQIFRRDRAAIDAALAALKAGRAFDEIAREGYPELGEGVQKPWELGPMAWRSLPEPWRATLATMTVGGTTGVIEGVNGRFWLLQLVERTENPELTFEKLAPGIREQLRVERVEVRRIAADKALRATATIEYRK
jgi:hypothetical protein